jgi:hypothetical protein
VPLDPVKNILMNNHHEAYTEALETGLSRPVLQRERAQGAQEEGARERAASG